MDFGCLRPVSFYWWCVKFTQHLCSWLLAPQTHSQTVYWLSVINSCGRDSTLSVSAAAAWQSPALLERPGSHSGWLLYIMMLLDDDDWPHQLKVPRTRVVHIFTAWLLFVGLISDEVFFFFLAQSWNVNLATHHTGVELCCKVFLHVLCHWLCCN